MDTKPIQLELRSCLCGCGMTFKVMSTSSHFYSMLEHDPSFKRQPANFEQLRGIRDWIESTTGKKEPNT